MAFRIDPPPSAHEIQPPEIAWIKLHFVGGDRSLPAGVAAGHLDRMPATSLERKVRERGGYAAMAVVVLLVGCALERPPGVVRVTYDCDEGQGFVARYERDGQVIVELGDREWVLPEVSAIAGNRYDDGTRELRLNGRNATLHGMAATYSNCVARDWQEDEPR
jgi:membrane-bound inhibitor of C-type lysozyme